ncbi:MAG: hypothetical protein ACLPYS_14375 [Vulcanimicrobiaceae bacterium]
MGLVVFFARRARPSASRQTYFEETLSWVAAVRPNSSGSYCNCAVAAGHGAVVAEYLDAGDQARYARAPARAPGSLYDPRLVHQP